MPITPLPGWKVNAAGTGVEQIGASAPLPGIQYQPGTNTPGGGGTDPNALKPAGAAASYGVPQPTVYNGGITSTSDTAKTTEAELLAKLDASSKRAPFDETIFINREKELQDRRDRAEAAINQQFDSEKTNLADQQNRETGTTSTSVARAGGYLGYTASGAGVLLTLAQSHRNEMTGLEGKRAQALEEARQAYSDKQFALAQSRFTEAKLYEQESYEREQEYKETVGKELEAIRKKQQEQLIATDIFDAIADGAKNESEVFEKLRGRATIDEIGNYFSKIKPKTASDATFKLSNEDMSHLLGAGLGQDDMQALSDYINKNGYTDELKATLTPYQQRVVDSIYRLKPVTSSSGLKADFIPTTLKEYVSTRGVSAVYEGLLSNDIPDWFYPILEEVGAGMDGARSIDPNSADAMMVWNEFKKQPEITAFTQQLNRKVVGSADAEFGALGGGAPNVPDAVEE